MTGWGATCRGGLDANSGARFYRTVQGGVRIRIRAEGCEGAWSSKKNNGTHFEAQKLACPRMQHNSRPMHRLRSPETIGQWALVLGLLLVVGPLGQSPCSWAAASAPAAPDAIMTSITPGVQWTCSEAAPATMARAVSLEHPAPSSGPLFGNGSVRPQEPNRWADASDRGEHRLRVSPVLRTLRPVVLQI